MKKINYFSLLTILLCASLSNGFAQHPTKIKVLDATIKDAVVQNATVFVQKNGKQSIVGTTDANGEILTSTEFEDNAETLLIIKKQGYSTLVVKCPCQGYTYALSPTLKNDNSIRAVLSWGSMPLDLDIHTIYGRDHVYYYNKLGRGANLDVDDRNGYGPETITISERQPAYYTFYVHDYSNRNDMSGRHLSNSDAKIFLYKGDSLLKTYYVPKNTAGNVWEVFSINNNNEILDYNKLDFRNNFDTWDAALYDRMPRYNYENEGTVAVAATSPAVAVQSVVEQELARGVAAYNNKEYWKSIEIYSSLMRQENYEMAPRILNNMALSFYRLNDYSKTMEISRKVLELDNTSNQDRANAYFNMGLVYEKQNRYGEAAKQYQSAANIVENNDVYLRNLKRVRKLIK